MDLLLELARLTKALDEAGLDYALCGGLALAVYARPRATLDIDLMVEATAIEPIKKAVEPLGFVIAAPPMRFHDGAVRIQRLIPFPDRFYLFQIKNHTVRHTRESGYPVFQRLPGFPHSRE